MNRKEAKTLIADLWKAGLKDEARSVLRIARGVSQDDRNLQFKIFNDVLNDVGLQDPRLDIDAKKGQASFYVHNMSILEFPRFLERLMRKLAESGTRKYSLARIDRSDPMKVFIKF